MQRDDVGTLAQLQQIRSELVDPNVATHRGHLVNAADDATLIEFGSADAALRCAVDIQRAMAVRNFTATPDERLEFRVPSISATSSSMLTASRGQREYRVTAGGDGRAGWYLRVRAGA